MAAAEAIRDGAPADLEVARAEAADNESAAAAALHTTQVTLDASNADPTISEAQLAVARSERAAAQAAYDAVRLAGRHAVAAAEQLAAQADDAVTAAQQEAALADQSAAADVAAKQAALDATRAGGPGSAASASAAIATAEAELRIAQANTTSIRLAGERAVAEAQAAVAHANAEVVGHSGALSAAESALAVAGEVVSNRTQPAESVEVVLGQSLRQAGVQVPADEIIFVPRAPVRVAELQVTHGSDAVGAVVSVTDATVYIDASLALDEAPLVAVGTEVAIDEPALGITAVGTINFIAAAPGTNGVDGFHIYAEIVVPTPPPNLVGASVRLTIAAESSGHPVLAVPVSAVTLTAQGTSAVEIHRDTEVLVVTVAPGLAAGGFVEISAPSGSITAGDLVLIGFDPAAPGG